MVETDNVDLLKKFVIAHLKRYMYEFEFLSQVIDLNNMGDLNTEQLLETMDNMRILTQFALKDCFDKDMVESTEMFQ